MKPLPGKKELLCQEIIDLIIACPLEQLQELQLDDISRRLGRSTVYLQKCFKESTQMTLGRFINEEKLNRALILLFLQPSLKVKTIAVRLGFSRIDYFIKLFKRRFGAPPHRYRELKVNHFKLSPQAVLKHRKASTVFSRGGGIISENL